MHRISLLLYSPKFGMGFTFTGIKEYKQETNTITMKKFTKIIMFLSLTFFGLQATAQDYKYHPSYIYNFTKYIQWPSSYQSGDFIIAVLGESPIIEELERMAANKSVGAQKFVIKKYSSVADIDKCHMLFIPVSKSRDLSEALAAVGSQSTLVLTEKAGMASEGSGINFVLKEGRWKFELNKSATDKSSLKVSSELAKLAILI